MVFMFEEFKKDLRGDAVRVVSGEAERVSLEEVVEIHLEEVFYEDASL